MLNFSPSTLRIASTEIFVQLASDQNYRIRVIPMDHQAQRYAVGAMRCENRQEVQWLSDGVSTPLEAVKLMQSGFAPRSDLTEIARSIVAKLLAEGKAVESSQDVMAA